jgi:selenocysteine lyase/cysteine desulfurase
MIGSYGTIPRPVSIAKEKLRVQIEGNPDRFMKRDWLPLLNDVREKSAGIIGAKAEECVIVPNTTHGVNTILHNIKWTAGDRIVICEPTSPLSEPQFYEDRGRKTERY